MAIEQLIAGLGGGAASPAGAGRSSSAAGGFEQSLGTLVQGVERSNADANHAVARMLDGSGDVHDAMIALQRADLTLQLTVQVRNKLVQAYQDIMRMPV